VIDELGYLPMPGEAASHFFKVISRRYENGSVILTTNRGLASWGEIFEDTTVAAAILDRLLHHATVLQIDGDRYRMRDHRARLAQLRAGLTSHPNVGNSRDHNCGILVIVDTPRPSYRRNGGGCPWPVSGWLPRPHHSKSPRPGHPR
jgi:hypothetical protein